MKRGTSNLTDWFFRLLVDSVRDYAIFALDANGLVASWNRGAERIKGYTEEEVVGRPFEIFFTPEDLARGLPGRLLETAAREGRAEAEGWRVRKDGSRFWADAVLTALHDDAGELIGYAKVTRDLTDRRAAEEQSRKLLREQVARESAEASVRRLELLSAASSLLASSLEYEATLSTVAALAVPAFADFCAVDLFDREIVRRVAAHHGDPQRTELAAALGAGAADPNARWRSGEVEVLSPVPEPPPGAGADHPLAILRALDLRAAIVAPLTTHGRLFGALTFAQSESGRGFDSADVTLAEDLARRAATAIENARLVRDLEDARRQLQAQAAELESQTADLRRLAADLAKKVNEAEAARAVAEEANSSKSRFLATMSHELRTPLNAIAGHADLLALGIHGPLTNAQRGALARIQRNERRLLALIDDILAFAKLEAGQLRFVREPVFVEELLEELEDLARPWAEAKGVDFGLVHVEEGVAALADPEKTSRILRNLADNAVKFTERGGRIEVSAEVEGTRVLIHVRDSGRGIPPNRLASIFEPFVQVDQGHTRQKEGLGLGLAISRELARNMDGDVTVESQPGAGSTFTLSLPRVTSFEAAA